MTQISREMLSKFTLICLAMFLTGCAGLDAQRMVPNVSTTETTFKTGQSINKIEIRGEREEVFGGPAFAKKDQIFSAAKTALIESNFFDSVDESQGDLTLYIVVRSQEQDVSLFLEYKAITTISYRFENSKKEVVWFKSLETEFSSHAFSGATRTAEAREGSVRENLSALIDGIQSSWGKE